MDIDALEIETAGQGGDEKLYVWTQICSCGPIQDGIAFAPSRFEGSWVISFADLERIYLNAKRIRDNRGDD